jgi:predicted Zn finger-like uncharacterized protein
LRFSCDKCGKKYAISDDKVVGRVLKVKCKSCGNVIQVSGPAEAPSPSLADFSNDTEETTRMMSREDLARLSGERPEQRSGSLPVVHPAGAAVAVVSASPSVVAAEWYAMIDGRQVGPMGMAAMREQASNGRLTQRTYVWADGMADWSRAKDVADLATLWAPAPQERPPAVPPLRRSGPQSAPAGSMTPSVASVAAVAVRQETQSVWRLNVEAKAEPAAAPENGIAKPALEAPAPAPQIDDAQTSAQESGEHGERGSGPTMMDPFAAVAQLSHAEVAPGEQTRFFIAQAGVTKRNSPMKVATWAGGAVGLLALLLVALLSFPSVRAVVSGKPRAERVFDGNETDAAAGSLAERQRREAQAQPASASSSQDEQKKPAARRVDEAIPRERPKVAPLESKDKIAALLQKKRDAKVEVEVEAPALSSGNAALDPDQIAKTVFGNQKAFQSCMEDALRRDPAFKVGRIDVRVTLNPSGIPGAATINKGDIDASEFGRCVKGVYARMVFPAFEGEPFAVDVPHRFYGTN